MDMKLNYKEYGAGEPVIILHGLLGMLDNWHSFAKKLSKSYWVILIDLRNHGKSPHSNQFSYELLATDIAEFMEQNHIPRAHIMGHSMGGKAVMQLLHDHSDKVEKAIVLDISPRIYQGGHEKIFEALLNIKLDNLKSRSHASDLLNERLNDLGTVNFLLKNLGRNPDGTFEWKANIQNLWNNYEIIRSGIHLRHVIETPSLFIKAEKSNYIQEDDIVFIKSYFKNASFVTIKNAGHWVHVDQSDALLKAVHLFLEADTV